MPLTFDLRATPWYQQRLADGNTPDWTKASDWPRVSELIILLMVVGIPEVTTRQLPELTARLSYLDALTNPRSSKVAAPPRFDPAFLGSLLGLKTNASTRTRYEFTKTLTDTFFHEFMYQMRRAG